MVLNIEGKQEMSIEELENENARLRENLRFYTEALAWYADPENHKIRGWNTAISFEGGTTITHPASWVTRDEGQRAREVLGEIS
jgi:hypothetical protein